MEPSRDGSPSAAWMDTLIVPRARDIGGFALRWALL
jgi:hypothetical protein